MDYSLFINNILKKSVSISREYWGKVSVTVKKNDSNQVLTEADMELSKYLTGEITSSFPEHNIIDEETGSADKKSEFTWVIDPIDGTANFASGLPMWGIMVGLISGGRVIHAGVALPSFSEIYTAEAGKGAVCNGIKIRVTDETDLLNVLAAYGLDRNENDPSFTDRETALIGRLVKNIRNLRMSNSVFDAMTVASGKMGAYVNQKMKIWDVAAPKLIIEEAGGIVCGIDGKKHDFSNPGSLIGNNFTFIGAAPALYKSVEKIVLNG